MELQFLGSGSAFTVGKENYNSNMLLTSRNGRRLLIDCGSDARHSLHDLGYSHRDVDDVYISHLHADHAGGLEWLGITCLFDPARTTKPRLYAHASVMERLWHNTLLGGMGTIQKKEATLSTYFDPVPVSSNEALLWEGVEFNLVQTLHVMHGYKIMPTYGLYFQCNPYTLFITADTQFIPTQFEGFYAQADLIFHDCETSEQHTGVHAHYEDLAGLPQNFKQKMWLYHYSDGALPPAREAGFKGFVQRGQVFDLAALETYQPG